ncbi:hypothetical protein [Ramlibacter sp.]|uniref:hypothetical protein n=1 Tax=Ramlibacter sp. TaxID=1917967 RepID=UPI002C702891|nr:hypothetical protein [Ramlibacter sp.]HWI81335.1 hypothetical protein [Ramlibacter sp.]
MPLHFLDFDYSEDADGHGSFDAMASADARQLARLQGELAQVLDWAHREFPGGPAPLEEGGDWDYQLQGVQETPTSLHVGYDPRTRGIELRPGAAGPPRVTLSLTLSGSAAFCDALRAAFGLDAR